MANYLRRALSYRNSLSLRASFFHGSNISHIVESPIGNTVCNSDSQSNWVIITLATPNSFVDTRRSFAKGRKSKDDTSMSTIEVSSDVGPTIKANTISLMEAAMSALSGELNKLRTGRASPGMLDHIIVEFSGVKMPLNHIAAVSVLDPKTLSIHPYDSNAVKNLESAIVLSPLGLNPTVDGDRLIAAIPPLTKEHIQAMTKLVTKSCEDCRQSIRRARQKAMDSIKKLSSSLPKDDIKRLEKEVEDLTKKFVKSAEDMCKAKEKQITGG